SVPSSVYAFSFSRGLCDGWTRFSDELGEGGADSFVPTSTGTVPEEGASQRMPKNATSARTMIMAMMTAVTFSHLRGLASPWARALGGNCGGGGGGGVGDPGPAETPALRVFAGDWYWWRPAYCCGCAG